MTLLLTKNSALCCFIYYIDFSHNFIFLILHLKTEHQTLPSKISSLMKEMWNSHKLLDFPTFSGGKIAFTSNATYILLYLRSRSTVCWEKLKNGTSRCTKCKKVWCTNSVHASNWNRPSSVSIFDSVAKTLHLYIEV